MVYDTKTLVALHGLTAKGEERYRKFLEDEGTRIIYRAQHPFRYRWEALVELLRNLFGR